ncbi:hypothetical protein ATE80_11945 [Streptomyces kanasensis]|uniref:Uncharacterized protein n=1 Tax=Streptomyces kanasensis TaxID=936756 RepID=A0A100Y6J6_9ACTN|nr:hypothetical protein ATE80_11945 [Streptomyces kanasensis]
MMNQLFEPEKVIRSPFTMPSGERNSPDGDVSQPCRRSGRRGSARARSLWVGSVRVSVTAAISSTGVLPPKDAYQLLEGLPPLWLIRHHWSPGVGSSRSRVFWSGLERMTRGSSGSCPWLQPVASCRGTVTHAGSPGPAR